MVKQKAENTKDQKAGVEENGFQIRKISAKEIPPKRNNRSGIYAKIQEQLNLLKEGEAITFQVARPGQAAGIAWHFRNQADTTTRAVKDEKGNVIAVQVYMTKKAPA
jgi:hypothetical protein